MRLCSRSVYLSLFPRRRAGAAFLTALVCVSAFENVSVEPVSCPRAQQMEEHSWSSAWIRCGEGRCSRLLCSARLLAFSVDGLKLSTAAGRSCTPGHPTWKSSTSVHTGTHSLPLASRCSGLRPLSRCGSVEKAAADLPGVSPRECLALDMTDRVMEGEHRSRLLASQLGLVAHLPRGGFCVTSQSS